jgi:hypothetical protein
MLNNLVSIHNIDTSSSSYREILRQVENRVRCERTNGVGHFTRYTDSMMLHGLTKNSR